MNRCLRLGAVLFFACACASARDSTAVCDLTVIVTGLKSDRGDVQIGLFNSAESFRGKSPKFMGAALPIADRRAEWRVGTIPFGEYAVKLFHDEDGDDTVDRNFIGMPTESIGFSNRAKIGLAGAPGFNKSKFLLNSPERTVVIELNQ
ncbi:DUF2141 domain-containing protein [bacterium]|nr:DUF2141 domain-containing protein [bacterium]